MERATAIKKLGKLLGKNLGYRVDPSAPNQDVRVQARADLIATLPAFDALKAQREARAQAVLAADTEYQRLKAECDAERERREKLSSVLHHFKFTAGTFSDMFFTIRAQGDSWEQVVEKIEKGTP